MVAYGDHASAGLTSGSGEAASTSKIVGSHRPSRRGAIAETSGPPNRDGPVVRASLTAAPRPAPGGWHPAPFCSSPKGRRPCRESAQRRRDPSSPWQISDTLPPAPSDISSPAQVWFPSLPILPITRNDDACVRNPFRKKTAKLKLSFPSTGGPRSDRLRLRAHAHSVVVESEPGLDLLL